MEYHHRLLFVASCVALIATAMSFAIRGDIMGDFEREFVRTAVGVEDGAADDAAAAEASAAQEKLVKTRLGVIAGVAFFSFGLAIFFGGPLVDLLGMGTLLRLAAVCHIGGTVLTIFAPSYYVVVAATLIIGAGNGIVEAVCNPLIATIYPEDKTHKLTLFHAWFPGGIVIGGVLSYLFTQIGWGWELKMALMLIPSVIYFLMIAGLKFPPTERVAAGVSFGGMFVEALRRPIFWIVFLMMWLTAATELGTGAWISNIYNDIMADKEGLFAQGGILALVWGSILMYILRQFFSRPVHKMSPPLLLTVTAPFAAVGLFLFYYAETPAMFFLAATLLYFGVCFWWPTMLGITSERCPKTGALGLAIIGGTGSFATSGAGPAIGALNDAYGPARCLQIWAVLPAVIFVVFLLVYLSDKARGGYKVEKIADAPNA